MSSLVLDLQQEILRQDCDVLSALRKAHLIASKLCLKEFDSWIQHELNGYTNCTRDEIPEYRLVKGILKGFNPYNGWIPAQCQDDGLEKLICEQKLHQSIGELQDLYRQSKGDSFLYQFPAELASSISSMFDTPIPMQFALHISTHLLISVVDKVKNCLLEWTIRLESEGIIGENMRFEADEKETAQSLSQQINNYYGTVVNGSISQSQIISGNGNTITYSPEKANRAIEEISQSLGSEHISEEDKASVTELLQEISEKISQSKKPSIIKSAFIGLKDFLLDAGASLTAALVAAKIQGLF